jgi:hypothetical protein
MAAARRLFAAVIALNSLKFDEHLSFLLYISSQMKVKLFHGDDLRVSTASRTSFNAESRALAWLAKTSECWTAQ